MKKFYLYILLLIFTATGAVAQNKDTKKADGLFEKLAYTEAITEYTKLIEKGKANKYVYAQLAESYAILGDTKKAVSFYKRATKGKNTKLTPDLMYNYAQALKANGDAAEYKNWMQKFTQAQPNDSRSASFLKNSNYLSQLLSKEPSFTVTNAGALNTKYADYGSAINSNTLYFASARNTNRKKHSLNNEPFLDIYTATIDGSKLGTASLLPGDVNTKYHEGKVAISPDGKRMYFDRNDYYKGDLDKDENGVNQINLYTAEKVGGEWVNVQSAPFNSDEFSTGHPAISPDGNTLYFSSDRPGGKGGSDLYMVTVNKDGTFGTPTALKNQINTEGTEVFPFIAQDGTLYFSSNGHMGMGGLDVFMSESKGANTYAIPQNAGPGINSPADDFSIYINQDTDTGFISSNRAGGKGGDDIYILGQLPPCDVDVALTVVNPAGEGIDKALVVVNNTTDNTSESDTATTTGKYLYQSKCNRTYTITASADGYKEATQNITVGKSGVNQTITLEPIIDQVVVTETEVVLNPIYFDFDKSNIRPSAAAELDRLVNVMMQYPTMVISAESHTDIRGSESYNKNLSQRRADSMRDYVVSKGINASRISSIGKGESEPAVACGTNCTEDEHQLNRRSVFKIVTR